MASEMMEALMALCQEKHIDELYLLDHLEQSLSQTYTTKFRNEDNDPEVQARATIDRATGKVYIYKLIPKGDTNEKGEFTEFDRIDCTPKTRDEQNNLSRIAAQHAKAEINQIVRNAAREQIYREFSQRVGDIITGTVLQVTKDFTIVKIREDVEAELPHFDRRRFPDERNERPVGERYVHNQRLRAIIIDVRDPNNQSQQPVRGERQRPSIVISRTRPELITRLFELEVPEVYDGAVRVCSVARDPGVRSKVAVESEVPHLDAVGTCVGIKGSRVRNVVAELRGERVDVVQWSDDPAQRVANALSPAKVTRVLVDEETNRATVIVPDDQLSLAIGKEGQNARLAAHLTGMRIDIKNESLAAKILSELPQADAADAADEGGHRCEYVGPTGIRCRNMARPGSHFCGLHEKLAELGDVEVSNDPDSLI